MKLFLSSMEFGNYSHEFKKFVGNSTRAGIILNASDFYDDLGRASYLERFKDDFKALGMEASELDLRKYFGKEKELAERLKDFDVLWAAGGNTFILRKAMSYSGLDKILPDLLKENKILYGGFSAGACVVCPTLRGIELADDPREVPFDYSPTTIWEGLNFVNFYIVPHYSSLYSEIDEVVTYYEKHKMEYHTLRDSDVIVVDHNWVHFFKE